MSQGLTVFVAAIIIGVISVAILAGYTSTRASKLPEHNEIIQVFVSGGVVGGFIAYLVTSGFLHGSSLMNMLSADVSSVVKDLKGGDDSSVVNTFDGPVVKEVVEEVAKNSGNSAKAAASVNIPALSGMVGGFLKSMGMDNKTLQELNVGRVHFQPKSKVKIGKVLIVDDSPLYQKILKDSLEEEGYEVLTAANGQIALDLLNDNIEVNLIITDIDMPVMDGWSLTESIRKSDKSFNRIPVIGVSGRVTQNEKERGMKCGFNDQLEKTNKSGLQKAILEYI